jgi:hypothetical protein
MIKIRMHRGGLQEAMNTMRECPSKWEIFDYLTEHGVNIVSCRCEMYDRNGDDRIGWKEVYIIQGRFAMDPTPNVSYPLAFTDAYVDFVG